MDVCGHVEDAIAHNEKWLPWVTAQLETLGLQVTPSVGNFILIHFPTQKGRDALSADELLKWWRRWPASWGDDGSASV